MVMILFWFAMGVAVGWLGSLFLKAPTLWALDLNVMMGVAGALLGGFVLGPMMGTGLIEDQDFSALSLLASFFGAVLVLALFVFIRRGRVR